MSSFHIGSEAAPDTDQPGLVERTLTRLFLRPVRVIAATSLSARFRLIDLECVAFESHHWAPGQKVQIKIGGGLETRTYTPVRWDAARGVTRIMAFAHGEGPGSEWVRRVRPGDKRMVFGPRRSLVLEPLPASTIVFGDETTFGLAASLCGRDAGAQGVRAVFEVGAIAESRQVLDALGIEPLALMERRTDDSHLAELLSAMVPPMDGSTHYVLTGKASSIRQMSRALKAQGVESRRIKAKAYWATGKTGLD
ncbi:siderophore-interacting protein [Variovorax sp. E3]|uniref:siderophore-interacting protein n=1 Tax=Variovorax sp. E3 TaxID=1914993 RepID=UPI0018DCAFB6|nr:siderophore-interacting protein [Variovorax sp. E3]